MNTLIELQIIAYVIESGNVDIITKNNIEPSDFTGEYQKQVEFILNHMNTYHMTPDHITMIRQFPNDYEQVTTKEAPIYLEEQLVHHVRYKRTAEVIGANKDGLMSNDPNAFTSSVNALITGLQSVGNSMGVGRTGTNIITDRSRLDLYQDRMSGKINPPIKFGLDILDEAMQGLLPDDLIVVFARSSHGKSYIVAVLASLLYAMGLNVLIYSGEMETEQVAYRFDTIQSGLSNNALMFGKRLYNRENLPVESDAYEEYLDKLSKNDNFFNVITPREDFNGRTPTVGEIGNIIMDLKPDVVFIDQLSLVRDQDKARTIREQYANIMRDFRMFAEVHQIPIFVAAQANREATEKDEEGGYKVPEPHQIAHADDVLHYATRVIGIALNRSQDSPRHIMRMALKKNRHAALVDFEMIVDFDKGIFEVAPQDEEVVAIDPSDNIFQQFADGELSLDVGF